MSTNTSEQQSNKYQLKTQLSQSGLQIKMVEKQNEMGQCYAATIGSLSMHQKLQENFDSLAELTTYLTQGNYEFCSSTAEFKIIVKVNSNKSKTIELARLQMVHSQPDLSLALQQLCQRCLISTQNNATSLVLSLAKIVKLSIQKQQKGRSKDDCNTAKKQEQYDTRLGQIRQMFELNIDQLQQQHERVHCEMYDQIQKLSHQLSKIQPQTSANPIITPQQSVNKIAYQNWNKHYKLYRNDKESRLDQWINLQYSSPNLKKYEGNRIASSNSYSTRMFSNFVVTNAYKFGILIQELGDGVDIGIISKANRNKNSLYTEKNSDLFVYKSDATYYDGKAQVNPPETDRKNMSFTKGDIVDVFVNLQAGSIEWSVKGQIKLSLTNYRLKNPETKWVVYVRLGKKCCVKLFL